MSIIQALIGSIVSGGSGGGGGGGGGGNVYPDPGGLNYTASLGGGYSSLGTPYNPGGAITAVASAITGAWRRITSEGQWSTDGGNNNPSVFDTTIASVQDAYGGFGTAANAEYFAMEWFGYFLAPAGAYHNIIIESDDVAMFWIGNSALAPTYENRHVGSNNNGRIANDNSLLLTEGMWYPIRMRFQEWSGAEYCQVYLATEGNTAYAMNTYATSSPSRLAWNSSTGKYGSLNSNILHLGSASTNVYSGTGNWLDSSPALNHAVPIGSPTWLSSDSGGVWQLDGTDWFNIPTLPYYNEDAMSYSVWFNCTADNTGTQNLIAEELTFKLRLHTGGAINALVGPGYTPWSLNLTPAVTYTYGTWSNITVTITNSGTVIYLNGSSIGTYGGISAVGGTDAFQFNIGCHNGDGSDAFVGKIGEVKVYSYGLTAQDVSDHYTATQHRYVPIGPYNTSNEGTSPGTVFFDTTTYPAISTVPVGALMKGTIFDNPNTPVTITASEAWSFNPTLWVVYYTAPGGTTNTTTADTFTFTWL